MPQWIASIPINESVALHPLVQQLTMQILVEDEELWLRGSFESEDAFHKANQLLRTIPGAVRYRVTEDNMLLQVDHRLPTRICPDGSWQTPQTFLKTDLPTANLAGMMPKKATIEIVRAASQQANVEGTPSFLECDFDAFKRWALQSSKVRLGGLSFACGSDGNTFIRGTTLPYIEGTSWIEYGSVAIPIGYSWQPAVSVQTLNSIVKSDPDTMHFLSADNNHRKIDLNDFVKATPSSVRATAFELEQRHV